jgi:hypothetical protein
MNFQTRGKIVLQPMGKHFQICLTFLHVPEDAIYQEKLSMISCNEDTIDHSREIRRKPDIHVGLTVKQLCSWLLISYSVILLVKD